MTSDPQITAEARPGGDDSLTHLWPLQFSAEWGRDLDLAEKVHHQLGSSPPPPPGSGCNLERWNIFNRFMFGLITYIPSFTFPAL